MQIRALERVVSAAMEVEETREREGQMPEDLGHQAADKGKGESGQH